MDNQKSLPNRKSPRASWHDYNGGEYFVTVCAKNREHFFGEIVNGEMQMSRIGAWADEQLRNVSMHYPYAEIPLWVVMPNHIHAIVMIDGNKTPHAKRNTDTIRHIQCRDDVHIVPTDNATGNESINERMQYISHKRGLLSTTIGGLKRAVICFANENGIPFAWQTRFHDHIIRNQDEMNRIAEYIENNVACWNSDMFNGND